MNHKIGLMGFGVVGQGYHTIAESHDNDLLPYQIVIKEQNKSRPQNLPFIFNAEKLIDEAEIGIELISDSDAAYKFIRAFLERGKRVITANKKVIAANLPELIALQKQYGGSILYEAAVAASIPVICNLQTQYYGDEILEIKGILNGSSNYILSQIFRHNLSLHDALALAQKEGFAEADPSFDINGSDVASKLTILITHAFNEYHPEASIPFYGIEAIGSEEIDLARTLGLTIKLIASATKTAEGVTAYIFPTFVDSSDAISAIEWEYNCVKIKSKNLGEQFFKGKGAGSLPTGSAVYSDLVKMIAGFKYQYAENIPKETELRPISTILTVTMKTTHGDKLKRYGINEAEIIHTADAAWFVGDITTEFFLANKSAFIGDAISIINIGSSVTAETVKKALIKLKYKEHLLISE
ncbi:homoserine dehydrogenase [Anditalea andensis]|uniref:Homoserine dehydrogenase n=1 Tax=Anditalea andensis TaxID=1048983 RepID=A0A074L120_9BACT|nr:homoserine dehydrogenase [Anditalea andensis]KEO74155.1 hypothetical protein EL17_08430 [Anditalea andensis]